jgi:signal transduction histidine kinase
LAQVLAEAREEAVADERERLAGDLHDTVGQALVAIRLLAKAHEERLGEGSPLAPVLARIAEMATAGKGELTEVARSLAFAPVGRRGLVPALRDLTESFSADSGIDVVLTVEGRPRRLPEDLARALYRVAHEALMNAWRHAACRRAEVQLVYEPGGMCLTVADDGVGIDPSRPVTGIHLGVGGMHRAMAEVGGTTELRSGRDHGTVVEARAALAARR